MINFFCQRPEILINCLFLVKLNWFDTKNNTKIMKPANSRIYEFIKILLIIFFFNVMFI